MSEDAIEVYIGDDLVENLETARFPPDQVIGIFIRRVEGPATHVRDLVHGLVRKGAMRICFETSPLLDTETLSELEQMWWFYEFAKSRLPNMIHEFDLKISPVCGRRNIQELIKDALISNLETHRFLIDVQVLRIDLSFLRAIGNGENHARDGRPLLASGFVDRFVCTTQRVDLPPVNVVFYGRPIYLTARMVGALVTNRVTQTIRFESPVFVQTDRQEVAQEVVRILEGRPGDITARDDHLNTNLRTAESAIEAEQRVQSELSSLPAESKIGVVVHPPSATHAAFFWTDVDPRTTSGRTLVERVAQTRRTDPGMLLLTYRTVQFEQDAWLDESGRPQPLIRFLRAFPRTDDPRANFIEIENSGDDSFATYGSFMPSEPREERSAKRTRRTNTEEDRSEHTVSARLLANMDLRDRYVTPILQDRVEVGRYHMDLALFQEARATAAPGAGAGAGTGTVFRGRGFDAEDALGGRYLGAVQLDYNSYATLETVIRRTFDKSRTLNSRGFWRYAVGRYSGSVINMQQFLAFINQTRKESLGYHCDASNPRTYEENVGNLRHVIAELDRMYPADDPEKQAEKMRKFGGGGTIPQLACTDGRVEQMLSFLFSGNVMLERHRPLHARFADFTMTIINNIIRQLLIPFVLENIRENRPVDESMMLHYAARHLHYNAIVGRMLMSPEMREYRAIERRDRGRSVQELDAELFEFVQSLHTGFGLLLRRNLDTDAHEYPIPVIMPPAFDFDRLLGGLDIEPEERAEVQRVLSTLDRTTEHGTRVTQIRRPGELGTPCRQIQVVPLAPYYHYWAIKHAPGGNVRQIRPLATFIDLMRTCGVLRVYEATRYDTAAADPEIIRCIETLTPQPLVFEFPLTQMQAPPPEAPQVTQTQDLVKFLITLESGDAIMRHLHELIPIVNFGRHRRLRNAREFVQAGGNPRKYLRAVMKALFR